MNSTIGNFEGIPIVLCKCGCPPRIVETYDTLQIVCDSCGLASTKYFRDYYDEGFMMQTYAEQAIKEWNGMVKKMKTCKDCIHYDVCLNAFGDCLYKTCYSFKDKSKFIELPCSIGSYLWDVSRGYPNGFNFDATDGENFISLNEDSWGRGIFVKKRRFSDFNKTIFSGTYEEAEKKLEELNHDN